MHDKREAAAGNLIKFPVTRRLECKLCAPELRVKER